MADEENEIPVPKIVPALPFEYVKFVSARESEELTEPKEVHQTSNELDGEEVSKFYQDVISAPSSSTANVRRPIRRSRRQAQTIKTSSSIIKKNESDFFKYVQSGKIKEVTQCLKDGFSPNQPDQFGWTPLMIAACANEQSMVLRLLEEGADAELRNPQGLSALDMAMKHNIPDRMLKLLDPIYGKIMTIKKEKIEEISERTATYCDVCKKEFEDSRIDHERSIAHLFNAGHSKPSSTFYHIPESNKGFQIMLKDGWDKEKGLGPDGEGQKYPVKTVLRKDRSCIGTDHKAVARITHFQPYDTSAVKRVAKVKKLVLERERTLKKREREKVQRKFRQKEIDFRRQFYAS